MKQWLGEMLNCGTLLEQCWVVVLVWAQGRARWAVMVHSLMAPPSLDTAWISISAVKRSIGSLNVKLGHKGRAVWLA